MKKPVIGVALISFTLIGRGGRAARTRGGAHPTAGFRLDDHFLARIPNARTINPITGTTWEGVGVIPDIAAAPDDSMRVATAHCCGAI